MFKKLFRGSSGKGPVGAQPLTSGVKESILNVIGHKSIPPMPGAAQKAFKLSTDPNAEARDFIDVIESDEALSARVVKIANSVYFDRGKPSKTIEDSVLVIGINELRCLLSSTSLSDLFPSKNPIRLSLWAHDVATALIAKQLAGRMEPAMTDLAFLCGLMHDIGKLLLLQRVPEEYQKIQKAVEESGRDFASCEEQLFVFTHTEVGQMIAEKWNFGPELIESIRHHNSEWSLIGTNLKHPLLVKIVKASSIFAHSLGLGHGKAMNRFRDKQRELAREAFTQLGLPLNEEKGLFANFSRLFETEFDLYSGKTGG